MHRPAYNSSKIFVTPPDLHTRPKTPVRGGREGTEEERRAQAAEERRRWMGGKGGRNGMGGEFLPQTHTTVLSLHYVPPP